MKRLMVVSFIIAMLTAPSYGQIGGMFSPEKTLKKLAKKANVDVKESKKGKFADYKKHCIDSTGLFRVYSKKGKYLIEIPDALLERDMLLGSRLSKTSDNREMAPGRFPRDPQLIFFSRDTSNVYLHQVVTKFIYDKKESIAKSYNRNAMTPIIKKFSIKALNGDESGVIIDITSFFTGSDGIISPFSKPTPYDGLFGIQRTNGSINSNGCKIISTKSFDKNLQVKSRLTYDVKKEPYIVEMTRNIILLPKKPARIRYADERIGYFDTWKHKFTEKEDMSKWVRYITRHNFKLSPENLKKHKRGIKVAPENPIVFYIDDAFPKKWSKYIKKGIEAWQEAFELIGYKNAIIAKDYPKNDPEFDPDDFTKNCFRYIMTRTANAMGPSCIDPRSGEIINMDVMFYHNVVKLVHDWRFIQTAAVDPRVRKDVFDTELMGETLEYVAAHEVGHCLGLMHNFGASASYPVEKLRDPKFCAKYGTTPSIMDYARNNYVAQPGDGVRKLTPPKLGVYDKYAIKWGYKPVYGKTVEEEKAVLNKWILDAKSNPMLHYGQQEIFFVIDPANQSESLGDDCIKASDYGIKNLKIILKNLKEWSMEKGEDYSDMYRLYNEAVKQYARYLGHVYGIIGGKTIYEPVYEEGNTKCFKFVSKAKQKEAVRWMWKAIKQMPEMFDNPEITRYFLKDNTNISKYTINCVKAFFASNKFASMSLAERQGEEDGYYEREYLLDVYNLVYEKAFSGEKLNYNERHWQYAFLNEMLEYGNYFKLDGKTKSFANNGLLFEFSKEESSFYNDCPLSNNQLDEVKKKLMYKGKDSDVRINLRPIIQELLDTMEEDFAKAVSKATNSTDRAHYKHLLKEVKRYNK